MTETERFFALTTALSLAAGIALGYGYARHGQREATLRADSLRVELTRLDGLVQAQDSVLVGESARHARRVDSLQSVLRRANGRVVVLVDTLRTFALPEGAQRVLDSLADAVSNAQAVSESLIVAHRAQLRLFDERLSAKDSAIATYRRLAEAALRQPVVHPSRTLRTLAVGVLAGALLWETIR